MEQSRRIERELVRLLIKKKLLIHLPGGLQPVGMDRNAGHLLTFTTDPISALERLRASTVCVLGVGGVGSCVVQHLAGVGVRNYVLVDHDRVEAKNLNRQFIYTLNDVGRPKIEAAKDFIASRVTEARVLCEPAKIITIENLTSDGLKKPWDCRSQTASRFMRLDWATGTPLGGRTLTPILTLAS